MTSLLQLRTKGLRLSLVPMLSPSMFLMLMTMHHVLIIRFINVYVKENSPTGQVIHTVTATDADLSENAKVTYAIINNVSNMPVLSMVNINSETGEIVSLQTFNYEDMKTFQFKVQATDSGVPPLSSNATVNVCHPG